MVMLMERIVKVMVMVYNNDNKEWYIINIKINLNIIINNTGNGDGK